MQNKLIALARSFVGYLEKATNAQLEDFKANAGAGNYTIFGKWYDEYYHTKGFNGAAWCHDFVSYCANRAGVSSDVIPVTASCAGGVAWFKQRKRWRGRAGYAPKPGDIIYFTQDGIRPVHVGIVYAVDATKVCTIEGNTSNAAELVANGGCVARKAYLLTSARILGYGCPEYVDVVASVSGKLSLTAEYWQNVVSGKTAANADYLRGVFVKVARKAGREYTDATLYAVVDSILGLTSDDYWREVIAGRRVATGENVRALFERIDKLIK